MQFLVPRGARLRIRLPSQLRIPGAALLLAFVATGELARAQGKLNPPLARPIGGDIQRLRLDSDGTRVVYVADQDEDDVFELYAVKASGAATVKLSARMAADADVARDFAISPDDAYVVFRADADMDDHFELFSVPIDGGIPRKLNTPITAGGGVGLFGTARTFVISPDGTKVVYRARQAGNPNELFVVPIDGSAAPLQLSGVQAGRVGAFRVTPDGARALYQINAAPFHLFSAPLDGSLPAVRLNANQLTNGKLTGFEVSADGTRVVYRANQARQSVYELFSVPSDGSAPPIELSHIPLTTSSRSVFSFALAGRHVVYRARQHRNVVDLYSVPIDGGRLPVHLNAAFQDTNPVLEFAPSPDGRQVAFLLDAGGASSSAELHAVPIDGSAPPALLNAPSSRATVYGAFGFSDDSTRVVYRADQDAFGVLELYSVPADGSQPPVKLNPPLVVGGDVGVEFTPAGQRVVFQADAEVNDTVELYSVPLSGGPAVRLNGPFVSGGDLYESSAFDPAYQVSSDGLHIAFLADAHVDETVELFYAPVDGSLPALELNLALSIGPVSGNVFAYELSPDGATVVYRADQFEAGVFELLRVSTLGARQFARLNEPLVLGGDVSSFKLAPGGARVAYLADQRANDVFELFSVPADASAPAVRLSANLVTGGDVSGYLFTPDATRIVYRADQEQDGFLELYSVPADGSGPALELSGTEAAFDFRISPDGSRVVFKNLYGVSTLFSAPIDGSAAPVQLSGTPVADGSVAWFGLSSLGRVLYLVDQGRYGARALYSVPIDASSAAVQLNGPVSGIQVPEITFDGLRVVFSALLTPARHHLFGAPIDGSTPAALLTGTVSASASVLPSYRIAPGDRRVLFLADAVTDGVPELFSVPLDVSASPVRLNGTLVPGGMVRAWLGTEPAFHVSPDGMRVAYTANQDSQRLDLYVVPIDGTAPSRRLNRAGSEHVWPDFRFTPDGGTLLYRTLTFTLPGSVSQLFRVAAAGGEGPKIVGDPERTYVTSFTLGARGDRVVYTDASALGVQELYLAFLGRVRNAGGAAAPIVTR